MHLSLGQAHIIGPQYILYRPTRHRHPLLDRYKQIALLVSISCNSYASSFQSDRMLVGGEDGVERRPVQPHWRRGQSIARVERRPVYSQSEEEASLIRAERRPGQPEWREAQASLCGEEARLARVEIRPIQPEWRRGHSVLQEPVVRQVRILAPLQWREDQ